MSETGVTSSCVPPWRSSSVGSGCSTPASARQFGDLLLQRCLQGLSQSAQSVLVRSHDIVSLSIRHRLAQRWCSAAGHRADGRLQLAVVPYHPFTPSKRWTACDALGHRHVNEGDALSMKGGHRHIGTLMAYSQP